jgi:hypothetical protein
MKRVATPDTRNSSASRRIDRQHQRFQRRDAMRALDVKAPGHIEHADVVEDQNPEGGNPNPIQIDAALSCFGSQPRRLCYDLSLHGLIPYAR